METFLEFETMCLDTCSWKVWRKSIEGKWQKWCIVHVTKTPLRPIFALSPKPIARFHWKRARQSFQASVPPAKFHPNPSKFLRFISENDLPDHYNIITNTQNTPNWFTMSRQKSANSVGDTYCRAVLIPGKLKKQEIVLDCCCYCCCCCSCCSK